MAVVRLIVILVFLAALVLLAVYFATRNKKYLEYTKRLLKYTGWLLVILFVLYLIGRVIRF